MSEWLIWLVANWANLLGALGALLGAVVALLIIIPGNQGEEWIQKVADFLKKIAQIGVK